MKNFHAHLIADWASSYTCSRRTVRSVAQPHQHSERYWSECQKFTVVAEPVLVHRQEKEMATAEQMQEALQQIQVLTARIGALENQLQFESARAQTAEQERSALIQTLGTMRTKRADAMVDTKEIGQPFALKGIADQNFGEWSHKVRTFMLARFGDDILTTLIWAA